MGFLSRGPLALLFLAIGSTSFDSMASVLAYNPALPSNDTSLISATSENYVQINWGSAGQWVSSSAVSKQLVNPQDSANQGYRGALVHFSENNATVAYKTSWIALISCDVEDEVPGSTTVDILTQARGLGAQSAIFYSLTADTCAFNQQFVSAFNGTMDVFVTTSIVSATGLTQQFSNVAPEAYWFNASAMDADSSIQNNLASQANSFTVPPLFGSTSMSSSTGPVPTGTPNPPAGTAASHLIATILNTNLNNSQLGSTQSGSTTGGSGTANTGLAMIILYAITGCVILLFLVVITSGAIRAMRHPERYGPRARNRQMPGDNGQSRAGGLTKAILDTFPVVKFLSGTNGAGGAGTSPEMGGTGAEARRLQNEQAGIGKDEEDQLESIDGRHSGEIAQGVVPMFPLRTSKDGLSASELQETESIIPLVENATGSDEAAQHLHSDTLTGTGMQYTQPAINTASPPFVLGEGEGEGEGDNQAEDAKEDQSDNPTAIDAAAPSALSNVDPADVNDSITCPICLLDFEDGDDIRILPCDSRHRFHDACVVPWLLNVSSLCPLCRLDLAKDSAAAESGTSNANTTAAIVSGPSSHHRSSMNGLASQFRNLIPGLAGPGNNRGPISTPAAVTSDTTGPAAAHDLEAAAADVAASDSVGSSSAQAQAPAQAQSRFIRYVQQRRTRVRDVMREAEGPGQSGPQSMNSYSAPPP